jgi:hypothetical protein
MSISKTLISVLLATILIFSLGLGLGIWIERERVEEIGTRLLEIDNLWHDARLQSELMEESCEAAIEANIRFAERILDEGLKIERYEKANVLTSEILLQKKRYVLLQLQFWLNAVRLKEKCNATHTTVLYFYSQFDESVKLQQNLQSQVLVDLIHKCKEKLMVSPIPIDLGIGTVDMIKSQYNITKAPSILINESILLEGLQTKTDLEKYIKC